ncbi:MAG: RNA polymerase sigma factor [Flavobacteriia bacterium]|nr:RNA polymerase sigma factor [Flavobacteriia bacterium]
MHISPEILEACLREDRKAMKQLYEYCFKLLMPVCFRYHSNEEEARSSLNLGFMKIIKGLENILKEEINFDAWSKRVMVNTLIDEYRKNKTYNTHIQSKETERELDYHASSTSNDGESAIGYENILKLIKDLPVISGKVFNLYVIEGYSHREIGELLEMSEGTSKWHLSTARKLLREKLEKLEQNVQKMVI